MQRLSWVLCAGLGLAGCAGEEEAIGVEDGVERQELTVATLVDGDARPLLSFGYSRGRGWHVAAPEQAALGGVPALTSPLEAADIFENAGEMSGPQVRFSGTTAGSAAFSGGSAAASGFSGTTGGSSAFSGAAPAAGGFSGSLSNGTSVSCNLSGLCDFAAALCDVVSEELEGAACDGAQIGSCYAQIYNVQVPAQYSGIVCQLADFLGCIGRVARLYGFAEENAGAYTSCVSSFQADFEDFFEDESDEPPPDENWQQL